MNEISVQIDATSKRLKVWYVSVDSDSKMGSRQLLADANLTTGQIESLLSNSPSIIFNVKEGHSVV